ncbi:MAG: DUF4214 domain-containing protein [Acidimicrobiales bacterium]|nr:DUF4214 domain-containing protein [Acidimicrobiales bacterium]
MCECTAQDQTPSSKGRVSRRSAIAGGLALAATPFAASRASAAAGGSGSELSSEGFDTFLGAETQDFSFLPPRPAAEKHVRPMMFPVLADPAIGKPYWSDTYLAPRSSGRKHEGQDLMGPKLLKLLACVDGTIVEFRHQASGNSLYLKGDDGWYYCYLHINNDDPGTDNGANQFKYAFAPGMEAGKRVLKGQHIAYLGDSGNAESTGAHCHFEIRMPNAKWYNAAAVNAKYSLDAAEPAKIRAQVPDSAFQPLANAEAFASRQATDFLGAVPSAAWLSSAVGELEGGVVGLDPFIENLLSQPGAASVTAPTIRLYLGYFLRIPDYGGLTYWINRVRSGTPLDIASGQFAGSSEFTNRYGNLSNSDYIDLIYQNLFGRAPDSGGKAFWQQRLDAGAKRGWFMRQLCESPEYIRKTASQVRVIQVYVAMLNRSPDASGYEFWSGRDSDSETGLQQLISAIRGGSSYASRFSA